MIFQVIDVNLIDSSEYGYIFYFFFWLQNSCSIVYYMCIMIFQVIDVNLIDSSEYGYIFKFCSFFWLQGPPGQKGEPGPQGNVGLQVNQILTRSIRDSETSIDFVQDPPGSRRERVNTYSSSCSFLLDKTLPCELK